MQRQARPAGPRRPPGTAAQPRRQRCPGRCCRRSCRPDTAPPTSCCEAAGEDHDNVTRNPGQAACGDRETRGPASAACPLPASGRCHPPDHRRAGARRSAGGYRHHPCHLCRSQRCRRDCCCACRPGGPGAGRAGAGGLRHRGRRRGGRHVALPPVPAAGQPGGRRGIGGRRADRDRSARGRAAAPRSGGRSRPVAVAYRRVAGGPRASGRRRGGHGRRRAVAQPPVAARPPGSRCGWPPWRG